MVFYKVSNLSEICTEELARIDDYNLVQGLSNLILPYFVSQNIFSEFTLKNKYPDFLSSISTTNIKGLTTLYISLHKKNMFINLKNYETMDISKIRILCLDFCSIYTNSFNNYNQALSLIKDFSFQLVTLEHIFIKWESSQHYFDSFKHFFRIFQHLTYLNTQLHSLSIIQKSYVENQESRHLGESIVADVNYLTCLILSLPHSLQHLTIIRHGEFLSGIKILDSISNHCLNIQTLCLHGVLNTYSSKIENIKLECLLSLPNLKELDISVDRIATDEEGMAWLFDIKLLVTAFILTLLKNQTVKLITLDLSGISILELHTLKRLVKEYTSLTTLRLCMTSYQLSLLNLFPIPPRLKILEFFTIGGVCECLSLYRHCPSMTKNILLNLFNLAIKKKLIIPQLLDNLINTLIYYKKNAEIGLACTACIYNVIHKMLSSNIPLSNMGILIDTIVKLVNRFENNSQLVRNCLALACKDTIISKARFNVKKCIEMCFLVLNTSSLEIDTPSVRMAVALISVLASRLETEETAKVATSINIELLLNIVEYKMHTKNNDTLLYHALVSLWNLTDDCASSSSRYIQLHGIDLYLRLFEIFPDVRPIETKIYGILNNISEVPLLRHYVLRHDLIIMLLKHVNHGILPSAFFAAGVLSNILIYWSTDPSLIKVYTIESAKKRLKKAVDGFGLNNTQEIVVYRSFDPFLNLLTCGIPESVWWATWSIRHVVKTQPDRYRPFISLKRPILNAIQSNLTHAWPCIRDASSDILKFL